MGREGWSTFLTRIFDKVRINSYNLPKIFVNINLGEDRVGVIILEEVAGSGNKKQAFDALVKFMKKNTNLSK